MLAIFLSLFSAFTLSLQIPFQSDKELNCFFNYTINREINVLEIVNNDWYIHAQYYDNLDLPQYYNDTKVHFSYFEGNDTTKFLFWNATYNKGSSERFPNYFSLGFYTIKNGTNGEFEPFFSMDEFPQLFRVLENYGSWMIVTNCIYSQSILYVYLISQQPVTNENDLQLAEIRIKDFRIRYERFYPDDYYVYPLQLPKLIGRD